MFLDNIPFLKEIIAIIIGYLLGSIPTAYLITKYYRGVDIRDVDIGNVGGGSVLRQVGIWQGIVVLAIDMGKGAAAVLIARYAFGLDDLWVIGVGLAAILGHIFPVFIGFRGGQGVATIIGIYFVLAPLAMSTVFVLLGIPLFTMGRRFIHKLFLIICITAPLLLFFCWLYGYYLKLEYYPKELLIFTGLIIVLLVAKNAHRLKEFGGAKPVIKG